VRLRPFPVLPVYRVFPGLWSPLVAACFQRIDLVLEVGKLFGVGDFPAVELLFGGGYLALDVVQFAFASRRWWPGFEFFLRGGQAVFGHVERQPLASCPVLRSGLFFLLDELVELLELVELPGDGHVAVFYNGRG